MSHALQLDLVTAARCNARVFPAALKAHPDSIHAATESRKDPGRQVSPSGPRRRSSARLRWAFSPSWRTAARHTSRSAAVSVSISVRRATFFDTLVALGFLTREGDRYANTPETDRFLDRKASRRTSAELWRCATNGSMGSGVVSPRALRTGLPQNEIKSGGPGLFESFYADPARLKLFLGAMTGLSRGANLAIARNFRWKDYTTFVDVGTAQGDLAVQVALANPHLRGRGFDLDEVRPIFEEYAQAIGVADRALVLSRRLLQRAAAQDGRRDDGPHPARLGSADQEDAHPQGLRRVAAGGALIVYEAIIDDDRPKNAFGLLMSLNMLIETPGGFDYTGADCFDWMKEAGLLSTGVEPLVGPDSMVVGTK